MRNHHCEGWRGNFGGFQVEPPLEKTVHIVGATRINQEMLVIGGDDMTPVSLSHIHKIDFEDSFGLHLRFLDIAVRIPASHLHILHLLLVFCDFDSHIVVMRHIRFDIVAKQQLLDKGEFLFPCFGIGLETFQFHRWIDRIGRFQYSTHIYELICDEKICKTTIKNRRYNGCH